MVIVTGTKRSGTSLWMRMLREAGLPSIGEAFPAVWGDSIRDANPHGFYESRYRLGIYFATNPEPTTGFYLTAKATRLHAVKVFVPGVIRTERAYLHRVVACMREWRSYSRSIHRLTSQEDAWLQDNPKDGMTGEESVAKARAGRSPIPAPVEWFLENYELVRDFAVRRYAMNFMTYERLMDDPEAALNRIFEWIGTGDIAKALACVDRDLHRAPDYEPVPSESEVSEQDAALFDAFYQAIHEGSALPPELLGPLNDTWARLSEEYSKKVKELEANRSRSETL